MTWLIIVIIAYIFYASVFIIDKYILSKELPHPIVYAFYVGILSISIWLLIPFGFSFPNLNQIILVIIAGVFQVAGWILLYKALNIGEVSRITPFIGSAIAIFTLIFSRIIIGETLNWRQLLAFIFLVLGGFVISVEKKRIFKGFFDNGFGLAFSASLFFALFWVLTKYIFRDTTFINGIIWIRTGVAIIALTLLLSKKNRELIFKKTEKLKLKTIKFFIGGRLLGILGALGIYWAVFLGSVTLVNSLEGIQYVFVLFLALLLFKKFRNLREQFSNEILFQKILAVVLISLGLVILVI